MQALGMEQMQKKSEEYQDLKTECTASSRWNGDI